MTDTLAQQACRLLTDQKAFVRATIVSHAGSTPRTSGTQMIIDGNGGITGTIGGGLLEARVMQTAVNIINEQGASTFMPFDLTDDDIHSMDMICGGRAEIFLDHIQVNTENDRIFKAWHHMRQGRANGFFVTAIAGNKDRIERVCHAVMGDGTILAGALPLMPEALAIIQKEIAGSKAMRVLRIENTLLIIEPAIQPQKAILFGAGHVAQPTAHLCAMVGFYVTVLDDREAFANRDNFPDAHEIHVLASFENAFVDIHVDENAFIVILTRGHLWDKQVLAQALKTRAGYIGMIGSRKKRDAIFRWLLQSGYHQADIERVHSPIGLAIGAKTPPEIAVSIVSEMIQERSA